MLRKLSQRLSPRAATLAAGAVAAGGLAIAASQRSQISCSASDGVYVEMRSSIFVINGFYMAMREKYTKPTAQIYYYLVEWGDHAPLESPPAAR